jgi:hypothetical protein
MRDPSNQTLSFYATPHGRTDPADLASCLQDLPTSVESLSKVLQNVLVHVLEAWRYGLELDPERKSEVQIGNARGMLKRIVELDPRPLARSRLPECRVVATCHDYAVLLCAMLRHQGRPARARAGFASYLNPARNVDHWLCEYWSPSSHRWVRVDAQLDGLQRSAYGISFDPCDVPATAYLSGAEAWHSCRTGRLEPASCGFSRWGGWGYVRHVLLRDLLALDKQEGLPWEPIGIPYLDDAEVAEDDRTELDAIARTAMGPESQPIHTLCERVLRWGRPPDWSPWTLDDVP